MDFLELVKAARTCRRFHREEGLPEGTLDWLVDCARVTPCAGNAQALRYAIAETPETCAALYPAMKWAAMLKEWGGPVEGERPAGYIVICGSPARAKLNAIDAGIACQTMQLAAQTRDIGCCVLLSFNPKTVSDVLGLSEEQAPILVLAFGKQKEIRRLAPLGEGDKALCYYRDEAGVHYVPKRELKDLIIVRK